MMLDNMTVTTETIILPQLKLIHSVGQILEGVGREKGQVARAIDEYIERKQEIYSNSVIQAGTTVWAAYSLIKNTTRIGTIVALGETATLSPAFAVNGAAALSLAGVGAGVLDIYASAYAGYMMMSGDGSSSEGSDDPCPDEEGSAELSNPGKTKYIVERDPAKLRLPPERSEGADPFKLIDQIKKYGGSTKGMEALQATEGKGGELMINDGVTRATRISRLSPGTKVTVEIIDKAPNVDFSHLPTVGGK